jgi:hypothetical protein
MSRRETPPALAPTRAAGAPDGGRSSDDASRGDRLTRRVVWTEETADCASCGEMVALATRHYHVVVDEADAPRSAPDRDELVFCSRGCASEWR